MSDPRTYIARLIFNGQVRQVKEFEAKNDASAWRMANDGVDPLRGLWVEVTRKPSPQQSLPLE